MVVLRRPHGVGEHEGARSCAGITRKTPNPKNGVIVKDPKTGEPTGVLKEAAQGLVRKVLPEPTRDDRLRALRAAIAEAHRFGVTSVQNAQRRRRRVRALRRAAAGRRAEGARLLGALGRRDADRAPTPTRFDALRATYPDDPLFKTGAIKLMVDGVIEAHTAAMLAPVHEQARRRGHAELSPTEELQPHRHDARQARLAGHDPRDRRRRHPRWRSTPSSTRRA